VCVTPRASSRCGGGAARIPAARCACQCRALADQLGSWTRRHLAAAAGRRRRAQHRGAGETPGAAILAQPPLTIFFAQAEERLRQLAASARRFKEEMPADKTLTVLAFAPFDDAFAAGARADDMTPTP